MEKNSTTDAAPLFAGEAWFDPIEAELRERVRGFLEEMVEQEATAALGRGRYQRGAAAGYRNGTRSGGCWARSARSRSRFPGPGCWLPMARAGNGGARCCRATPG